MNMYQRLNDFQAAQQYIADNFRKVAIQLFNLHNSGDFPAEYIELRHAMRLMGKVDPSHRLKMVEEAVNAGSLSYFVANGPDSVNRDSL